MTIELIGVPTNSSGTTDGVARAPAALRAAGLVERLRAVADVIDGGDLLVDEPSTGRGADGVIDGANLARTLARLGDRVAAARRRGDRLLLVGGDCPILLGALAGCADADADSRAPGLLFVDGHEDAWPPHASTTGEAADMELGWLLGRGLDQLDPALAARIPRLDVGRVAILGPRDRAELVEAGVEAVDDRRARHRRCRRPTRSIGGDDRSARPGRPGRRAVVAPCRPRRPLERRPPGRGLRAARRLDVGTARPT